MPREHSIDFHELAARQLVTASTIRRVDGKVERVERVTKIKHLPKYLKRLATEDRVTGIVRHFAGCTVCLSLAPTVKVLRAPPSVENLSAC